MKRNRLFLLSVLLPALSTMQAQTSYEAAALLNTDLSGTARYVGMGGAMSALGADMSTMSTNPAGIGLYRSWDLAMSLSGNWVTQRTWSNQNRNRLFDPYGLMDNIGMVIANKMSNNNTLRFVNFGFNYRNVKRFDGKMGMSSNLYGLSQTGQMARQAYDNIPGVGDDYFDVDCPYGFYSDFNHFKNKRPGSGYDYVGWLTLLGAKNGLIDESSIHGAVIDGKEYPCYYYPSDACNYNEILSGGIDAYDFNLSFNLEDAIYLGVTFTTYDVERRLESHYTEYFYGGNYTLDNYYLTTGTGYDFKFGAILRPFPESSFRIGVSATTPTVYDLRDYNSAIINSTITFVDNNTGEEWTESFDMDTQHKNAFGGDCYTDYTMTAPAKLNVSLGGTIGTSLALGAEYEYSDYGTTKLYYEDGDENTLMNDHTTNNFTGQHTLRLGAEKTFGSFYTRFGYNYQSSGYKADAWKMIPVNSVQTNTAYKNLKSTQNYTCGIGFRGDTFYADAALLYSRQTADFYPFEDIELEATQLSRNLVKGMMTIGLRF